MRKSGRPVNAVMPIFISIVAHFCEIRTARHDSEIAITMIAVASMCRLTRAKSSFGLFMRRLPQPLVYLRKSLAPEQVFGDHRPGGGSEGPHLALNPRPFSSSLH